MGSQKVKVLEYLERLPFLHHDDREGILWVLSNCPDVQDRYDLTGRTQKAQASWSSVGTMSGIHISRQLPVAPERVYKVRGEGRVKASVADMTETIVNIESMKMWDPMLSAAYLLDHQADALTQTEVALGYGVYSLPGLSSFFYDRTFFNKVCHVRLPDDVRVFFVRSMDEIPEYKEFDPPPPPRTVRGRIGPSGYVVKPDVDGHVSVTLILQVDPKGSVPAFIVNMCNITIPLSIDRMRTLLKKGKLTNIIAQKARPIDRTPLMGKVPSKSSPPSSLASAFGVHTMPPGSVSESKLADLDILMVPSDATASRSESRTGDADAGMVPSDATAKESSSSNTDTDENMEEDGVCVQQGLTAKGACMCNATHIEASTALTADSSAFSFVRA